jgi:hypothetical protein
MENSDKFANWIDFDYNIIEDEDIYKYKNIAELPGIKLDYNFGDVIELYHHKGAPTHIIGKEGNLVRNPDYSGAGYFTVPYEITQYLDNATEKYKNICYRDIDLRHDDKFLIKNVGKIPKSWNFKFTYTDENELIINFPNNTHHIFNLKDLTLYKIKNFYDESFEEQTIIKLKIKFKKYIEKYPDIPSSWFIEHGGIEYEDQLYKKEIIFKGPIKYKKQVQKNIKEFYKDFMFKEIHY